MAARRSPRVFAAKTVADLLSYGTQRLQKARLVFGHGTTNAAGDAAFLAARALRVRPEQLPRLLEEMPTPRQQAAALRLFERRITERKPAAYIANEAWLGEFPFYVDERVIVPRSHIAGLLRDRLAPWVSKPGKVRTALDLGTGSGCLAVLLARSFPGARIDAADISPAALAVARINVGRYRLGKRIRLIESNLFSALRGKRYDVIVCNPPYVTAAGMRRLPREYRHEPRIALTGGKDGLAAVRRIVHAAGAHLNPGGQLVVEVGGGRRRVERAFPRAEFVWPETGADHPVFIASREQLSADQERLTAKTPRRQGKQK